jgi:hypothetical protein
MTRHFVTACREWQLGALLRSMSRHCRPFVLHVLAWDWEPAYPGLSHEGDAVLEMVTREGFLRQHPGLLPLPGAPRSHTDEVCSVRWTFLADVMRRTGQPALAVDGDVWFMADPAPALEPYETAGSPLIVTEHGFAAAADELLGVTAETHMKYGRLNCGFVQFRDVAAADLMAELCREWCRTEVRTVRGQPWFGDQGALDEVARLFGAETIAHPGVNLAPWNLHVRAPLIAPVGFYPAIAFHFSSLRFDGRRVTQLANAEYAITSEQAQRFYAPYVQELETHAQPPG